MELEAGKTYVYKSEADKKAYFADNSYNRGLHDRHYNKGFTIEAIADSPFNGGYIKRQCVIGTTEIKYFKLKEEETMKPTDMITVEMTALDALRLRALMANVDTNFGALYLKLKQGYGLPSSSPNLSLTGATDWSSDSRFTLWALAQFDDPKQKEIDELEKTINEAAAKLAALKG
tara:strand:+ start:899 stop:1423 length:525 start_codon:yes stop_codon:yes gene_type:complete